MAEAKKMPLQDRIRRTFIAGIFSSVPLAVTAFIVYWIDDKSLFITKLIFPKLTLHFVGVVIALAAIYLMGVITTSFLGKFLIGIVDGILVRLPVVRQLYQGWKHIALTPGGTEGTFSRVVLIPDESGQMKLLGFTSARIVESDEQCYCVFVPSSPNPITGRLYIVPIPKCQIIEMSPEEAFKVILSTGNYVPPLIPANKNDSAPAVAITSK